MIQKGRIEQVVNKQHEYISASKKEVPREQAESTCVEKNLATIVTGIRRCGKSTLMRQVMLKYPKKEVLYLNFDDISLTGFEQDDFIRLHALIEERGAKILFFDEIQLVSGWEIFIHQLLREGFLVYITGSNASMLSVELGTHLTGRHLSEELFPFSYTEYLLYTKQQQGEESFLNYLKYGGMPEYLATHDRRVLLSLVEDILIRDIAIRRGIRNVDPLKRLAVYLLTNAAKPFTGNRLSSLVGDMATSTVLDYVDYLRDSYLVDTIGQYSLSMRTTIRNPKKVYALDTGIVSAVTLSQSEDLGRLLENYMFIVLRKQHKGHLYYYRETGECDFVVTSIDNTPQELYQVCMKLTDENFEREIGGLREAMRNLHINSGNVVTLSETDHFNVEEGEINIVRAF